MLPNLNSEGIEHDIILSFKTNHINDTNLILV